MPRVSLLFLDDTVVGSYLRLIRLVCQPESTSRPHITVRVFDRLRVPPEYSAIEVHAIDLVAPGSFRWPGVDNKDSVGAARKQTVFIKCRVDDLFALEHKPDFPGSEFHITLYDGLSARLAAGLLVELRKQRWGFRVPLPPKTRLTLKELRQRPGRRRPVSSYSTELKETFASATGAELTREFLDSLSEAKRVRLCGLLLASLMRATRGLRRLKFPKQKPLRLQSDSEALSEVHHTPPELAREIARVALGYLGKGDFPIDFGDPAVGSGAFFAALLSCVSAEQISSAIGVDLNAEQVAAAKWRWAGRGMRVVRGDYLHMEKLPRRTLILANPPYLRHQGIPSAYKENLRQLASVRTGFAISAQSGLYVYFLLLAHDWLGQGGIGAWLIPSEFMRTSYGRALRVYFLSKVTLLRVHQFGHDSPQFENVDVAPALVVFRKAPPPQGHRVHFTRSGSLSAPKFSGDVLVSDLLKMRTWGYEDGLGHASEGNELLIEDLFWVKRGIATGANSFFVMPRSEARKLGIPQVALRPLLPKARTLSSEIIEREPDGYPRVSKQLCLLDCDLPIDIIRHKLPRLAEYLDTARGLGLLDRHLIRARKPWYKQERREVPPFLCTYMGRGAKGRPPLWFIWNKSDAVATNTYLLLYPKPDLAALLAADSSVAGELLKTLNESAAAVVNSSRIHAGGLRKIEPSELMKVRLQNGTEALKAKTGQLSMGSIWEGPTSPQCE